jgi:predicted ATP-dependent Lon-type protease
MVDMLENKTEMVELFNKMQLEVLRIGKTGILKKYHPDANIDQEDCFEWFNFYKDIMKNMEQRVNEFECEFSDENFSEFKSEILRNGWVGAINKYHPDFNIDCENAQKVFDSCREVYDVMKERLLIA